MKPPQILPSPCTVVPPLCPCGKQVWESSSLTSKESMTGITVRAALCAPGRGQPRESRRRGLAGQLPLLWSRLLLALPRVKTTMKGSILY